MSDSLQTLTVRLGATLRETMVAIDRGGCEIALVVDSDDRLRGTATDGDIRRAILAGAGLDACVDAFMHGQFTAVAPRIGRAEVLDLMRARSIGQIPIVDEAGRLVGLHLLREIVGAVRRPNWAIVLAGGRGERLRPLTDALPKPMLPVAGRPILERLVLHLVGFGIRTVFLSVNYMCNVIEEHFGDGSRLGCEIRYLRENIPLGTGGSLSLLPEAPAHPLLALNGDLVTQFDVGALLAFHEAGGFAVTVGVRDYLHTVPFGVIDLEGDRVAQTREKPTEVWHANAGIYVLEPYLVGRVPHGAEFQMPALIEECLRRDEPVGAFRIEDEWIDVGHKHELRRARGEEDGR
jgi:dTDP-glucose pyrophosphorylase